MWQQWPPLFHPSLLCPLPRRLSVQGMAAAAVGAGDTAAGLPGHLLLLHPEGDRRCSLVPHEARRRILLRKAIVMKPMVVWRVAEARRPAPLRLHHGAAQAPHLPLMQRQSKLVGGEGVATHSMPTLLEAAPRAISQRRAQPQLQGGRSKHHLGLGVVCHPLPRRHLALVSMFLGAPPRHLPHAELSHRIAGTLDQAAIPQMAIPHGV